MTPEEAAKILRSCIHPTALCRVGFRYDLYPEQYFPLAVSDSLFLAVTEQDFQLDGYTVRRLSDIVTAEAVRGAYLAIHKAEGSLSKLFAPPVLLDSWRSVFTSLASSGEFVIAEENAIRPSDSVFLIGKILRTGSNGAEMRCFDADGVWDGELTPISFSRITSVTFGSRYISTYAKYIKPFSG